MTTQTFDVTVGFTTHRIELASDPESGRTSIRLNGRMAARPLGPDDAVREIMIETERYEVRRLAGDFELNYIDGDGTQEQARSAYYAQARRSGSHTAPLIIGIVVVGVIVSSLLFLAAPAAKEAAGIGWYTHTDPDNRFTFQMPAPPRINRRTVWGQSATGYSSMSGTFDFYVGYVDLETELTQDEINPAINGIRDALLKLNNAVAVRDEDTIYGSEIVARSAKSGTEFRFRIMRNKRRIYLLAAAAPEGELGALIVARFFSSFRQLS